MQKNKAPFSLHEMMVLVSNHIQTKGCTKEYDLITLLDSEKAFAPLPVGRGALTLFRKHFLVMNILYGLRSNFLQKGWWLSISSVEVALREVTPLDNEVSLEESSIALGDFYSDWSNYYSASDESVDTLLSEFWQRYSGQEKKGDALAYFGLSDAALWPDIQVAYRKKATETHPDKGGDAEEFIRSREHFLVLKKLYAI